jgi:hypothetical protein
MNELKPPPITLAEAIENGLLEYQDGKPPACSFKMDQVPKDLQDWFSKVIKRYALAAKEMGNEVVVAERGGCHIATYWSYGSGDTVYGLKILDCLPIGAVSNGVWCVEMFFYDGSEVRPVISKTYGRLLYRPIAVEGISEALTFMKVELEREYEDNLRDKAPDEAREIRCWLESRQGLDEAWIRDCISDDCDRLVII